LSTNVIVKQCGQQSRHCRYFEQLEDMRIAACFQRFNPCIARCIRCRMLDGSARSKFADAIVNVSSISGERLQEICDKTMGQRKSLVFKAFARTSQCGKLVSMRA
jgi:hypothetical protein